MWVTVKREDIVVKNFKIVLLFIVAASFSIQFVLAGTIKETRELSGFKQIKLNHSGELVLIQGSKESVVVEVDQDDLEFIETYVSRNVLVLDQKKKYFGRGYDVTYYVTYIDLDKVRINGSGSISADKMDVDEITFGISGSGNIDILDLNTNELDLNISGSGSAVFKGSAPTQNVSISGSGDYFSKDLIGESVSVRISGSGHAEVYTSKKLNVKSSGSGDVVFYGQPKSISNSSSGSSKVYSGGTD